MFCIGKLNICFYGKYFNKTVPAGLVEEHLPESGDLGSSTALENIALH